MSGSLHLAMTCLEEGRVDEAIEAAGDTIRQIRRSMTPNAPAVRAFKEALVSHVGPEAAALAFARMTGIGVGSIPRLPITSLQDIARQPGGSYEEVSPPRLTHMPEVPVFNGEGLKPVDVHTRSFFRCALEDVIVSSKSNFLITANNAVLDYQSDELEQLPFDFEMDPIAFGAQRTSMTALVEANALSAAQLDLAIPLVGLSSHNYWHWLIEYLPRLLVWRDQPGFGKACVIVDQVMPPACFDALRMFAGRDIPIVVLKPGEAVRTRRLWGASMLINLPHWPKTGEVPEDALTVLDAEALARQLLKLGPGLDALGSSQGVPRVYLKRGISQLRSMVNTEEVEAWFAGQGFQLFEMGDLGFVEQVRLMRGAEIVVAPNGAALTNTLFARPGTRIGVFDNPRLVDNHWYAAVCAALGHRLCYLPGKMVSEDTGYNWNGSYRIDLSMLPSFLNSLLAGTS